MVAPLFWFVLLGLPGAALFALPIPPTPCGATRCISPGDQGRNWAWAGKWAARVDDALGWVPARITAVLILLVGVGMAHANRRKEAARTPSPNSGWPMAAMWRWRWMYVWPTWWLRTACQWSPGPALGHRARRGMYASNALLAPVFTVFCCYCSNSILESAMTLQPAWWPRRAGRAALGLFHQRQRLRACPAALAAVRRRRQPLPRSRATPAFARRPLRRVSRRGASACWLPAPAMHSPPQRLAGPPGRSPRGGAHSCL